MSSDQIAQLDLLMARVDFHKKTSELFMEFVNTEWPDLPSDEDKPAAMGFRQCLQVFAEYHIARCLELRSELRRQQLRIAAINEGNQAKQS